MVSYESHLREPPASPGRGEITTNILHLRIMQEQLN